MELLNPLTVYRADQRYHKYLQDVACLSTDLIGDLLYIRGDRVNGKWRVSRADPGDLLKMPSIGILISKSTPTVGVMQLLGPVFGIFTGLETGRQYCVDYNGIRLGVPILGIGGYSIRQFIGISVASDVLLLNPSLDMTINKS